MWLIGVNNEHAAQPDVTPKKEEFLVWIGHALLVHVG
jgi:hypothetical protein